MACRPPRRPPSRRCGDLYRRGVNCWRTAGRGRRSRSCAAAVAVDERSALAHVALAVAEHEVGDHDACRARAAAVTLRQTSRRERQHVAVIALALEGNLARASALGREHLREFAADDPGHPCPGPCTASTSPISARSVGRRRRHRRRGRAPHGRLEGVGAEHREAAAGWRARVTPMLGRPPPVRRRESTRDAEQHCCTLGITFGDRDPGQALDDECDASADGGPLRVA